MTVINTSVPKDPLVVGSQPFQLDANEFNKLIANHGVRVRVYKTLLCPNVLKIDTGEHVPNCPLCNKTNFLDRSPEESWAFFQNQKLHKQFNKEGTWDDQDVAATFKNDIELTVFSKVELLDFTNLYYELVQRQEGNLDRLKYRVIDVNILIDKNGVEYTKNRDFEIDTNNNGIIWIGTQPSPKTIYSVHYTYPITYRAIRAMHVNRFSQNSVGQPDVTPAQYPQQWVLKRDFLIAQVDENGRLLPVNTNFVETTPE